MCLRLVSVTALAIVSVSLSGCGIANKALDTGTRVVNGVTGQQFTAPQIPPDLFKPKPKPPVTPAQEEEEEETRPESGLSIGSSEGGGEAEIDTFGGANGEGEIHECTEYTCLDDGIVEAECASPSYGELKEQCELECEKARVRRLLPATVDCEDECNLGEDELRAACRMFVEQVAAAQGIPLCSEIIPCN